MAALQSLSPGTREPVLGARGCQEPAWTHPALSPGPSSLLQPSQGRRWQRAADIRVWGGRGGGGGGLQAIRRERKRDGDGDAGLRVSSPGPRRGLADQAGQVRAPSAALRRHNGPGGPSEELGAADPGPACDLLFGSRHTLGAWGRPCEGSALAPAAMTQPSARRAEPAPTPPSG